MRAANGGELCTTSGKRVRQVRKEDRGLTAGEVEEGTE